MTGTTLVALAAGAGSRFGGPKQLTPLGPAGETMLDFAIHDAWRAGFGKVVLVIAREMRDAFEPLAARWGGRLPVALVAQDIDDLPAGVARPAARTKPWGTGHAVLAARAEVSGPFAVINADDFYGAAAYRSLSDFFAGERDARTWAAVGFPLAGTLAETGAVNRALLRASAGGWLEGVEEILGIEPDDAGNGRYLGRDGAPHTIPGDALVSVGIWGFDRPLFDELEAGFRRFLAERGEEPGAEYFLPTRLQELVRAGRARMRVLRAAGPWCGVTHREDTARVAAELRALAERGDYPSPVWR